MTAFLLTGEHPRIEVSEFTVEPKGYIKHPGNRIYVQRRTRDQWVVQSGRYDEPVVLNRDGAWTHGIEASDEWRAEHWFTLPHALALALAVEPW